MRNGIFSIKYQVIPNTINALYEVKYLISYINQNTIQKIIYILSSVVSLINYWSIKNSANTIFEEY